MLRLQTQGMSPDSVPLTDRDELHQAVARGGPMDGAVLGLADAELYEVRLSDRTRWSYVATTDRERLADGSEAVVYVSAGRLKGV